MGKKNNIFGGLDDNINNVDNVNVVDNSKTVAITNVVDNSKTVAITNVDKPNQSFQSPQKNKMSPLMLRRQKKK